MADTEEKQIPYSEELKQRLTDTGMRLRSRFDLIATNRKDQEDEWLKDLRQFKGVYDPDVSEGLGKGPIRKSKTFIRMTRTKVKAMNSRMMQMLFPANSDKNWEIDPTPKADVSMNPMVDEMKQQAVMAKMQALVEQGNPPETIDPAQVVLSDEELQGIYDHVAKQACDAMRKEMEDQLAEIRYRNVSKKVIHQGNLYGTGVLKAPMVQKLVKSIWQTTQDGSWAMAKQERLLPYMEHVSVWDFYPDETATEIDDCELIFQYHGMNRSQVLALCKSPGFDAGLIRQYVGESSQGDSQPRHFEQEMKDSSRDGNQKRNTNKYAVLEAWCSLNSDEMLQLGIVGDDDAEGEIPSCAWCNVWLLGPFVIKAEIQPLADLDHPYHLYYFDKDETSIWGEGLASILRDDQTGLNAVTRAALDNAAATVGAMYEYNVQDLDPGEAQKEPVPGQRFHRTGNSQHPAIRAIQVESRLTEFMALRQVFEQNMHENSIPAYMHADQNVGGAGNTASGLSMLMGAANISITDQIRNWDDVTSRAIKALYHWNMQFNPNPDIKGDFSVVARGSTSLMAKEVRANQLNTILMASNNPADSAIIKRRNLWEECLKAQDMDPKNIINSAEEYDQMRDLSQQLQQAQQQITQMQGLLKEAAKAAPTVLRDIADQMKDMGLQEEAA